MGVAHPAGEVQRVVDALAAGGNVLVGQFFLPGGLADDIAADDADTAVGLRLGHRISQLLVLAHHVQLQLDPEKLVEPGSVAEHIGNADQTDPRTGKCQLRFELEHHGGQLLQGHTDLDHRQLDALLDDPSLHTAGHDQVTALPFQLSGPALSLARLDVFQGHERDGWECPDKGLCQVATAPGWARERLPLPCCCPPVFRADEKGGPPYSGPPGSVCVTAPFLQVYDSRIRTK